MLACSKHIQEIQLTPEGGIGRSGKVKRNRALLLPIEEIGMKIQEQLSGCVRLPA
ncbi:hypothetical protein D3C73_1638500 [compost metagenome]